MSRVTELLCAAAAYNAGDPRRIHHLLKVENFACMIAEGEKLDEKTKETLLCAAALHDIGIRAALEKYGKCVGYLQEKEGPAVAREILAAYPDTDMDKERICWLIAHHHHMKNVQDTDHQILIEADFLVNSYEASMSEKAVKAAFCRVFRTETGKMLLRCQFPHIFPRGREEHRPGAEELR